MFWASFLIVDLFFVVSPLGWWGLRCAPGWLLDGSLRAMTTDGTF